MTSTRFDTVLARAKALVDAERKSLKACDARGSLPAGSTRARVTTANANWARAAEQRDRCMVLLAQAVREANITEQS